MPIQEDPMQTKALESQQDIRFSIESSNTDACHKVISEPKVLLSLIAFMKRNWT